MVVDGGLPDSIAGMLATDYGGRRRWKGSGFFCVWCREKWQCFPVAKEIRPHAALSAASEGAYNQGFYERYRNPRPREIIPSLSKERGPVGGVHGPVSSPVSRRSRCARH